MGCQHCKNEQKNDKNEELYDNFFSFKSHNQFNESHQCFDTNNIINSKSSNIYKKYPTFNLNQNVVQRNDFEENKVFIHLILMLL